MRELHLRTLDPEGTRAVGATVADAIRPGDVVALTGELGAGKTCFVQGAAVALGVTDRVTSPSFVISREYDARIPVVHLDVYRLDSLAEVVDLGFEEIFDRDRVTFVEWGDAMSPLLPPDHLEVEFRMEDPVPGALADDGVLAEPRRIAVRPHGHDWLRRLPALTGALAAYRAADPVAGHPRESGS